MKRLFGVFLFCCVPALFPVGSPTEKILTQGEWIGDTTDCEGSAAFEFSGNSIRITTMHSGKLAEGTYRTDGNKITAQFPDWGSDPELLYLLKSWRIRKTSFVLTLEHTPRDFWSRYYLRSPSGGRFRGSAFAPPHGSTCLIGDSLVVKSESDGSMRTTTAVNLRSAASRKSQVIRVVRPEISFRPLARTLKKESIDGHSASWFYGYAENPDAMCADLGWVYGAYLEADQEQSDTGE